MTTFLMNESIALADDSDIADNLLHYHYNIRHLSRLEKSDIDRESGEYLSAYRSFEGEVFENLIYEKLIRYAKEHQEVITFLLKGPHAKACPLTPNILTLSPKGQIVYRTKHNEIGEFDALMLTKNELIFVEMTLVASIANLRKRLRKKRALLQTLFPSHDIRALLILNDGVAGLKQLPEYCTVWQTKKFSARPLFERLLSSSTATQTPFEKIIDKKMILPPRLKVYPFRYYETMTWAFKKLKTKQRLLNIGFLRSKAFEQYHDIFTKIAIGFIQPEQFNKLYPPFQLDEATPLIVVAIEKEATGKLVLTYFVRYSRKKLDNLVINAQGEVQVARKDPFGITVNEMTHMSYIMTEFDALSADIVQKIGLQLQEYNQAIEG